MLLLELPGIVNHSRSKSTACSKDPKGKKEKQNIAKTKKIMIQLCCSSALPERPCVLMFDDAIEVFRDRPTNSLVELFRL